MKTLGVLALLVTLSGAAMGQAKVTVSGNQRLAPTVKQIAEGLKTGFPVWHLIILNRSEWALWHKQDARDAICAFSIPPGRITFIDEVCLTTNDHDMTRILAHESGHQACACGSHAEADKWASAFLLSRN